MWIVIVEQDETAPKVVWFGNHMSAQRFTNDINKISGGVWPDSWHNLARDPQLPDDSMVERRRVEQEASEVKENS